jgi:hypothetical protein
MLIDLRNIETKKSEYSTIPDGTYTFQCTESELKKTKAGTGSYIKITLSCLNQKYLGKKVWFMFNIENPSVTAQNIGRSQLKEFLNCAGLDDSGVKDAKDLIGAFVNASIATDHDPQYGRKNIVTKWAMKAVETEKTQKTEPSEDVPY